MEESDRKVNEIIKEALDVQEPFEEIWRKSKMKNSNYSGKKKTLIFSLLVAITIIACLTAGFATYQNFRKVDKTDYPFVDDPAVIGKWKSVDFVKNMADFQQGVQSWKENLYLNGLVFIKGGDMLNSVGNGNGNLAFSATVWTKGRVLNTQEKTDSSYYIKDINGKSYLFMQWKSGDYIFDGMEPYFYVLEKEDSLDYSDYKPSRIEDKIDYPFETDVRMLGNWESVDFVKEIDKFKPDTKSWRDDLFLLDIEIMDNGSLVFTTTQGKYSSDENFWTKNLIISKSDKTASKCTIKEIDGSTYMFYEWKSGDYVFRGMTPSYYVLKKVQ